MSEGWLTESALLPKKPKLIEGLRTTKTQSQLETLVAVNSSAQSRRNPTVEKVLARKQEKREAEASARKRARKDLEGAQDSSERARIDLLTKKASIYDQLKSGQTPSNEVWNELTQKNTTPGQGKIGEEDLLVDFTHSCRGRVSMVCSGTEVIDKKTVRDTIKSRIDLLRQRLDEKGDIPKEGAEAREKEKDEEKNT